LNQRLFNELKKIITNSLDKEMVIWGAAKRGQFFLGWLERLGYLKYVSCFVDSSKEKQGRSIKGLPILSPTELRNRENCVVFVASAAFDEIALEIKAINGSVVAYNVCKFCVPSKLEEVIEIYSGKQDFIIVGENDTYKTEIAYLKANGINVSKAVSSSEIKKEKKDDVLYIVVDKNHIKIENALINMGKRYNREYIVLSDICNDGYNFTREESDPVVFDKGTVGDKGLSDYFCPLPFTQLYYYDFRSDICSPTWNNNINVGNPQENTIEELWNSSKAQEIRKTILDGSFKYCNEEICWRLLEGKVFRKSQVTDPKLLDIIENNRTTVEGGPEFLNIGYNTMCNLRCRMCRDSIIKTEQSVIDKCIKNLKEYNFANLKRLIIPGNGELFANKDYLNLLINIDDFHFPQLEAIWIYSNGVLFDENNWNKIAFLGKRYKLKIFISTDSACKETFLKVRRGGEYTRFINNVKMLVEKRRKNEFDKLYLPFCVQRENFREMEEFVYFAKEMGADSVHFEKLFNSTIGESVHRPENVYYDDFVKMLNKAVKAGKKCQIEVETKPFTYLLEG